LWGRVVGRMQYVPRVPGHLIIRPRWVRVVGRMQYAPTCTRLSDHSAPFGPVWWGVCNTPYVYPANLAGVP